MLLGRFEEAILMALIHINGQATIGDLSQALAEHKMRRSFGMLYTVLDRMRDCREWRANAVLRSRITWQPTSRRYSSASASGIEVTFNAADDDVRRQLKPVRPTLAVTEMGPIPPLIRGFSTPMAARGTFPRFPATTAQKSGRPLRAHNAGLSCAMKPPTAAV